MDGNAVATTRNRIILIGAGGHARSVMDSLEFCGYELAGFIDEFKSGTFCGYPIFGKTVNDIYLSHDYAYFICIGDVHERERIFNQLLAMGVEIPNIIDRSAEFSRQASMGIGNYIGKQAIVNADVTLGDNNLINSKALLEHGCRIASHTNISTGAILNGDVKVQDGVYFGSGAICNGQKTLGKYCTIGSGSVVTKNVESGITVVGIPARPLIKKTEGEA